MRRPRVCLSWRCSPPAPGPSHMCVGRPRPTVTGGGGEGFLPLTHSPQHVRKTFPREKMKFIEGPRNWRSILCTQTLFLAPDPLCDIPSGCCFFTGPWTVTRSPLRMLRRVATFCRPLRPVLLLVSFPRSRSPVVGVLGLCWMRHGVPFACQRRPIVGVLRMCWLLPGSFDCFCCPHTSVHRPSIACLAVFLCGPGAFLHALSGPSTICPFPPHGWSAPDGLPLLLRKQPIWAAGDTPHLMPVEQGLPWHPVATGLAGQAIPFIVAASHAPCPMPPPPHTPHTTKPWPVCGPET